MSKIRIQAKNVKREDVYIVARLHLSSTWSSVLATRLFSIIPSLLDLCHHCV